jgi:Tol biopolymer transport system component
MRQVRHKGCLALFTITVLLVVLSCSLIWASWNYDERPIVGLGANAWSPDGERLVFDWKGRIFTIQINGHNLKYLTHGDLPAWSPDGQYIAFSDRSRPMDIYVIAPDGGDLQKLTSGDYDKWFPIWSPDSAQIAYFQQRVYGDPYEYGPSTLSVVTLNGSIQEIGSGYWLSWAPTSREIALLSNGSVYIYNLNRREESPLLTEDSIYTNNIEWAPDGTEIAYIGDNGVRTVRPNGSGRRRLTHNIGRISRMAWSPDGDKMAFSVIGDEENGVYVLEISTNNYFQVAEQSQFDSLLSWSPDSRYLALQAYDALYVVDTITNTAILRFKPARLISWYDLSQAEVRAVRNICIVLTGLVILAGLPVYLIEQQSFKRSNTESGEQHS